MSEEIQEASYTLPRVLVWSTVVNGALMFVMAITICYCIGDLDSVLTTATGYPFIQIVSIVDTNNSQRNH
jgi:choline transport protein